MTHEQERLPRLYLVRHGETAWTRTGQHTGLTDLPLTAQGEQNARGAGERLRIVRAPRVLTSPLQRARRTCELAGFGAAAEVDPDLVEWNYGAYEGKTPAQIWALQPGWEIFRDGCPEGESPDDVAARVDRVVARVRAMDADTIVFSHGHLLRVLAARWLRLAPAAGKYFVLGTAALSMLGYHRDREDPVVRLWNDCGHVAAE